MKASPFSFPSSASLLSSCAVSELLLTSPAYISLETANVGGSAQIMHCYPLCPMHV